MLERVHEHIIDELGTGARTDTVFVLTAIVLNLVILGINVASVSSENWALVAVFAVLLLVVNAVAEMGLIRGRQMRRKLLRGLLQMYQDQNVAAYYDASLVSDYATRYNLFMIAVLATGVVALIVPFLIA